MAPFLLFHDVSTIHDVSTKTFILKGFNSHLVTLNNRHYTVVVLDRSGNCWLNCDDFVTGMAKHFSV